MRGQVLLVALLSAAPGHPALPSTPTPLLPATPLVLPSSSRGLAPSPYVPELAPNPFATPGSSRRAVGLGRSQRPAPRHVAALAPSPYELELVPNPYAGGSFERAAPPSASASLAVTVSLQPRVLAPSPYEPQLASALAPSPY